MAYVGQEKKAKIAAAMKAAMPKDWKYSLRVDNHTQLIMTISQAPIPEEDMVRPAGGEVDRLALNHYRPESTLQGKSLEVVRSAVEILNTDNFDNSDITTDYHHVGHYIGIQFGRWDKPFVNTYVPDPKVAAAAATPVREAEAEADEDFLM